MGPNRSTPLRLTLALALASVSVLGAVALLVAGYLRRTAEGVVRDHTALAAERLAEVVTAGLAQRIAPLIGLLHAAPGVGGVPALAPEDLRRIRGPGDPVAAAALLTFRLEPGGGELRTSGGAASPALAARIRGLVRGAAALPRNAYFAVDWPADSTEPVMLYDPIRDSTRASGELVGLVARLDTLRGLIGRITAGRRLLPRTLAGRIPGDTLIGFRLDAGILNLAQRGFDAGSPWIATTEIGPMFGGLKAQVSLEPDQASRLVIGGLPRYQGQVVAGVLGLALASLLALGIVVRRDRQLQRAREDFVAGVSHELRTPLAQIRLFGDTLALGRVRSEEERTRSLDIIRQETRRLAHLVDNLLQFARGERGPVALAPEPTDLSSLVDRIADEFAPLASGPVVRRIEPGIQAAVDPGAVRQVVLNLLDNAVKFGPRHQTVRIELTRTGATAEIGVADEGPGIPPESRHLVWRRFWRGGEAVDRGIGGTGIGLAIVADLVEAHGGLVAVGPAGPKGARFSVTLPLTPAGPNP